MFSAKKKKTLVSQTGKSGYKDVTVCSLYGHSTDSVIQGHTNMLNEKRKRERESNLTYR